MNKICVTGANGFIGKSLCETLAQMNRSVEGLVRTLDSSLNLKNFKYISVGDISKKNWKDKLDSYSCIIHCAGKAHRMKKKDKLDSYLSINTKSTKNLAEQAAKAGVKRFIFLSTVKVNGENTNTIKNNNNKKIKNKSIFSHNDKPYPQDAYAISKFEAEKILWEISAKTGLEVVILRLPLVYGKGVKGNLKNLIKFLSFGIPLPFSLVNNKRSLIGIDNLVDIIIRCIDHPSVTGKTFLISDGEDLSTSDLFRYMAVAMKSRLRLFPFPISILKFVSRIIGIQNEINRLTDSLQVDSSFIRETLNWTPPVSVEEGIKKMVRNS